MTTSGDETGGADPFCGETLDRRYRIDQLIGRGGIGAVYAAWHLNLRRPVAIKILHPHLLSVVEHTERFRREAHAMGLLHHRNFVEIIDFRYSVEGLPYLVMELVTGETLRARLRRGPLSLSQVAELFTALCEAVDHAHQQGVIHCDLKPDNLMFHHQADGQTDGEVLKILDLGSARLLSAAAPAAQPDSGTPAYLAPERLLDAAFDQRVDIFALGAILYECLTGAKAFCGDQPVLQVVEKPIPPLGLPDMRISLALDEVLRRACHKDPRARFSSAKEFLAQLLVALSGGSKSANLPSVAVVPESPRRPELLSDVTPLCVGVKSVLLHGIVAGVRAAGLEAALASSTGAGFLTRLAELVLTQWVDAAELHRLLDAAASLLGAEDAPRRLGRAVAELALRQTYRPLIVAAPDLLMRRGPFVMGLFFGEGHYKVNPTGPNGYELLVRGLRAMNRQTAELWAGFLEYALELSGARDVTLGCTGLEGETEAGWRFLVSFVPGAE